MIKIFCDSCKNEITNGLVSEFTLVFKDTKGKTQSNNDQ